MRNFYNFLENNLFTFVFVKLWLMKDIMERYYHSEVIIIRKCKISKFCNHKFFLNQGFRCLKKLFLFISRNGKNTLYISHIHYFITSHKFDISIHFFIKINVKLKIMLKMAFVEITSTGFITNPCPKNRLLWIAALSVSA